MDWTDLPSFWAALRIMRRCLICQEPGVVSGKERAGQLADLAGMVRVKITRDSRGRRRNWQAEHIRCRIDAIGMDRFVAETDSDELSHVRMGDVSVAEMQAIVAVTHPEVR